METTMKELSRDNVIGTYLSELRKSRKLTQEEFAEIMHMNKSTIAHYEQGLVCPNVNTLMKIADFFNVNIEYILGRSSYKESLSTLNNCFYNEMSYLDVAKFLKTYNKHDKALIYDIIQLINYKEAEK